MAGVYKIEISESEAELKELLRKEKTGSGKERIQVLYLLKTKKAKTVTEATEMLGRNRVTVQEWLGKYRQGGLETLLSKTKLPVFGTFMDGNNIYQETLPKEGIIVMGNEANGISAAVEKLVSERIAIPRFGNLQLTESLNVATATAIILSEFKRG